MKATASSRITELKEALERIAYFDVRAEEKPGYLQPEQAAIASCNKMMDIAAEALKKEHNEN